ncbi:MAG TPA: ABC transporter permease subunit, partial [Anaerolineales bacterium]|nr:ABC transporter permease subunit [Anaerolineales bacterium]
MVNYLIRRFFQMIIVVFLSTVAIYVLLNIAPGGPLSGIRLSADVKSRVSDADIARLKAYLGLDKPLALRYITWMAGDDWLGANWMYVGLGQYTQDKIGKNGKPIEKTDPDTGEKYIVQEKFRFWTDAGTALFNPGYLLWVEGKDIGTRDVEVTVETPEGQQTLVQNLPAFEATAVYVKPDKKNAVPAGVVVTGVMLSQQGDEVVIQDANKNRYVFYANEKTVFTFPEGEARTRPEEGTWVNISWLTGSSGILAKYAGFHNDTHGVLRLDFGTSWKLSPSQPVIDLIKSRLGNTLTLMSAAVLFSIVVGIPIGIYSAIHQYSRMDYAVTTFSFFGSAMPVFWFGLMMILLFSHMFKQWGWPYMPTGGVASVREAPVDSLLGVLGATPGSLVDRVVHLLMPTAVLSLLYLAGWSRFARSSMLEVLRQDYVRTARAKGLLERFVIMKHALRNALIPIVTILVFEIPAIFGGATITETIFSYPGMGSLYFQALGANDWPVVMANLLITAILVVFATLIRD